MEGKKTVLVFTVAVNNWVMIRFYYKWEAELCFVLVSGEWKACFPVVLELKTLTYSKFFGNFHFFLIWHRK